MEKYRVVQFEIPFHIRAPDGFENSKAQFYPRVGKFPVGLAFQTKSMSSMSVGGLGTVRRDRYGTVLRSRVRATIHPKFEESLPKNLPDKGFYPSGKLVGHRNDQYINHAVKALNKFFEIYREESGSYWIRSLEPGNIGEFEIEDFNKGKLVKSKKRTVSLGGAVLGGFGVENLQRIEQRLESGSLPNIYQTLHLDIREKIDQGEASVAIILANEMFERWIKNAFVKVVSSGEFSKDEAIQLIKKSDGKYVKLSNLLSNILSDHTGVNFQGSEIFEEWEIKLRNERNKVVHEDYYPTSSTAHNAHLTAIDTIQWFQEEFGNRLKEEPESVNFVELRETKSE